ncbi:SRPBCC family protein [Streptomyces sp. ACA25]|uniref:SRPBCC family protein n=1 Tax=Streptomyces sp. ACA25 TaxID=3022596 RepID=UPI0023077480|nr:SRPBCC family protein [Streptomyces sp. ACA25]MDB1086434.1 SRPBCC family protein [Streptomyces sp. ACA25]
MKIENEFTVSVPAERAWEALTDLEGLAPCMPGAQLTGVDGEVYSGKVKVKVGPVISQFAGTATFTEKDDANHHMVISAKGKDSRGGGNASALIDAQLRPDGARTVVTVRTDLTISGKLAQFGSGMIKEISEKLLHQFVQNLEAQLHAAEEPAPTPAPATPPAAAAAPEAPATTPAPEAADAPAPVSTTPEAPETPAPVAAPAPDPSDTAAAAPAPAQPAAQAAAPAPRRQEQAEAEPLDLMGLAGSSVYKRLIPGAAAVLVLAAVVIFLVVR